MGYIKKVFFFPDAARDDVRADVGAFQGTVNYVGVLGTERTTSPYYDAPLDADLAARLIGAVRLAGTEFVVVLKHDHPPKPMVQHLQKRNIPFKAKQETRTYPSSLIYLAALGRKVKSTDHYIIYRTTALDDVQWTISRYGSLDRVRVFITKSENAPRIAETLASPDAQMDYNALLDLCEYHTLFDYDWEYFYVMTRKPHVDHAVSWLRRVWQDSGIETDTRSEAKVITNLRGRLERLTGISLFYRVAPQSVA